MSVCICVMYMCHEISDRGAHDSAITSWRSTIWRKKTAFSVRARLQKTDKLYSEILVYEERPNLIWEVVLVV